MSFSGSLGTAGSFPESASLYVSVPRGHPGVKAAASPASTELCFSSQTRFPPLTGEHLPHAPGLLAQSQPAQNRGPRRAQGRLTWAENAFQGS